MSQFLYFDEKSQENETQRMNSIQEMAQVKVKTLNVSDYFVEISFFKFFNRSTLIRQESRFITNATNPTKL